MRQPLSILFAFLALFLLGSCKKHDAVDSIVGKYSGTLYTSTKNTTPGYMVSPDSFSPSIVTYVEDTNTAMVYFFSKVSADSFSTGRMFFMGDATHYKDHIRYNSSGYYTGIFPVVGGEGNDTLTIVNSSIYFTSHSSEFRYGAGAGSTVITKIFSGKKM